jgi:IstB-like ATP binding protein
MMSVPAQFTRADWSERDMEKWNARIEEILGRRLGTTDLPPVDWDDVNRQALEEWHAAKADVLLSRLPSRYRDATPRHDVSRRWLARYAEGDMINLAILGPSRVGKSWEAAAIARLLLLEHRTPVTFEEVPTMMKRLRPNADGASDVGQYQVANVLIMDDLGAENPSDWTAEQLYHVADFRAKRNLPTIVTSNLSEDGLDKLYGSRICDRLFEGAALLKIRNRPPEVPARFGAEL